MRNKDYLITTKVGESSRKFVWNSAKPTDLDYGTGWKIAKTERGLRIWDETLSQSTSHSGKEVSIPSLGPVSDKTPGSFSSRNDDDGSIWIQAIEDNFNYHVDLPPASSGSLKRAIEVDIVQLKPLRPAYLPQVETASPFPSNTPRQLYMFYGLRYFLVRYRPVGNDFLASLGDVAIFKYQKTTHGFQIQALKDGLFLKVAGEKKRSIPVGQSIRLSEHELFHSTFICGVHWWRFHSVPSPDALPPLTSEEAVDDIRERLRFKKTLQYFVLIFGCASLIMTILSKGNHEKKIVSSTQVTLAKPKLIPKKEEIKPPEPKKVVELDKPKPKEKPKPEQKIVKTPPKHPPKKQIAKKAAPKKSKVVKAPPPPVKSPAPPNPGLVAKKAPPPPPKPDPSVELAKSLSFLSPSNNKEKASAPTYSDKKNKNFATTAVGGGSEKSNVLNNMAAVPSDTNITTKSARTIASGISFGKGSGKGLNDVQGKVSSNELYKAGGKLSGGGGGISITGKGSASESDIEKALSKYLAKFQYCYEKGLLKDASIGGDVMISWDISTGGKASKPKVIKSKLNNAEVHACINKVLLDIPFPKPMGGSINVTKTFNFTSSAL